MKHLLIIGASSEISYNLYTLAKDKNYHITLTSSNPEKCDMYPQEIKSKIIKLNLESYEEVVKSLSISYPVDYLLFSPGLLKFKPLQAISDEDLIFYFNVNVFGFIRIVKMLVEKKLIKEGGSIVAISSVGADFPLNGALLYTASKSALNGAIRALAVELAPKKIKVNGVSPGIVLTSKVIEFQKKVLQTPLESTVTAQQKRHLLGMSTPSQIAQFIFNAFFENSANITGQVIAVDGGFSIG